jgi:hypothetical protein
MKTYNKTITSPRLIITHDEWAKNPRTVSEGVGYFFTNERRNISPDGNTHELYKIMLETADAAENTEDHIKLMRERAHTAFKESSPTGDAQHDEDLHVIDIFPVYKYEHGSTVYRRGTSQGFDYSNCGFYFVTAKSISGETHTTESLEKCIDGELAEYTSWANGEVYQFTLYSEDGETEEVCGGFYSVDDIKGSLPEEWHSEDLNEYIKN